MPRVVFITPDGSRREVEADIGLSLMEVAVRNGIDAVVAECGGNMTCSTCHVFISAVHQQRLSPIGETEDSMLDFTAAGRTVNSRLSCQIEITEHLDGLEVVVADPQV